MRRALVVLVAAIWAGPLLGGALDTSPRPLARGTAQLVEPSPTRPQMRPPSPQTVIPATMGATLAFASPDNSPRPWLRPKSVEHLAMSKRRARRKGAICGDVDIQGDEIGHVPGKINGCGIKNAVSVRSVSGVMLSRPATMDCTTAKALNRWVEKGVQPAFRRAGPVVEMRVAAHYACRTRNSQKGARISEHGKGKAIDISSFTMKSGQVITVQDGWAEGGTSRRMLTEAHKKACGPFGTVLGPQADRYHQDHFHMDTASYRAGPYCK